jgi:dTDP-4-dehydrorhamnose reductase
MAPTPVGVAAAAIAALLADRAAGIWQLTGSQDVSYAEIGGHIAQQIGAEPALVQPVAAASAGMPEGSTPRHTTLDSGALQRRFAIAAPEPWPTIEAVLGAPEAARSIG